MKFIAGLAAIVLALPTVAWPQALDLKRHAFGDVGASLDAGDKHLNVTVGQAVIGYGATSTVTQSLGFWGWTSITTPVSDNPRAFTFALDQNIPNPFNPATTISFSVGAGPPVRVSLRIYDVRGALVNRLIDRVSSPGVYQVAWRGLDEYGQQVASGVYFYQLRAGAFVQTKKLILLK